MTGGGIGSTVGVGIHGLMAWCVMGSGRMMSLCHNLISALLFVVYAYVYLHMYIVIPNVYCIYIFQHVELINSLF